MPSRTRLLVVIVAALAGAVAACNRADEFGSCPDTIDPAASPTDRIGNCPASTFKVTDVRWRNVVGKIWSGENGVPNAAIRMTATKPGYGADSLVLPATAVTDMGGSFGPLADAPMHYDITAVFGSNVAVARALSSRYFELTLDEPFPARTVGGSLDLSPPMASAFEAHVDVQLVTPLPEGMAVQFFTKGDNAISVSGDVTNGLTLVSTTFTSNATIHALAYPIGGDLADATLYATGSVVGVANARKVVELDFKPMTNFVNPSVQVTAPPGFTKASIDLIVTYSRTSRAYATSLTIGQTKKVPVFNDSTSTAYRIIASAPDGRTIDTGIVGFSLADVTTVDLSKVVPTTLESPAPNATSTANEPFAASGLGIFEYVLTPETPGTNGPVFHVITPERSMTLPDLVPIGQVPHGRYTWTVRNYTTTIVTENLSGRDARRALVSGTSAPRTVVFP